MTRIFRLLRLVSWREAQDRFGRAFVVVAGIATGVTLIVAIDVINRSVLANVRDTIEALAGPAALQITLGVGEVGFDESIVGTVRGESDVAAAVPFVRGTVTWSDKEDRTLQLFGVDLTQEADLGRYSMTAATDRRAILRGLESPNSVLVPQRLAEREDIAVGTVMVLATPTGVREFTVTGLLTSSGPVAAFGGQLLVMDLPAAQLALGRGTQIDQVDVIAAPSGDVESLAIRLGSKLPPGFVVARPEQRGEVYGRVIGSFQALLRGLSSLCLVAGLFIVYNATSTGAVHRAAVLSTMSHIGATPSQILFLLLMESVVLGGVGALAGVAQGLLLGRLLASTVTDSMGVIFQLRFFMDHVLVEPLRLAAIVGLGVMVCVVASWFAARRVATIDPLIVSRGDLGVLFRERPARELLMWWVGLVALSVAALGVQEVTRSVAWGSFGSTLWFSSSIIVAVPIVTIVSKRIAAAYGRIFGPAGRVAAESIQRSPVRAGVTVAAIALVLTIALSVTTIAESFRVSVNGYFASGFLASDLVVSATSSTGGWLETAIVATVADEVRAVAGVRTVELLRILPGQQYRGERIAIAGSTSGMFDASRHPPGWYVEGDAQTAEQALKAGTGARISISLSDRFDLHVGDLLEIDSPTGTVKLDVVGVVPDYMSDRGGVGFHYEVLRERWRDEMVNRIAVFLEPGVTADEVRESIERSIGGRHRLRILSLNEVGAYHESMITRAFAFTDAIQLLIAIVTIAGILDLLLSAVGERRRELGIWRIIGADDRMVARAIIIESTTIGALGLVLGLFVGAITAWIWVKVNFRHLLGYYLDYSFASDAVWRYAALTMIMTLIAGCIAARYATRQPLLDAVQAD